MRHSIWLLVLTVLVGCTSRAKTFDVQGEATYGGKAIESGRITFLPVDGTSGHSATAPITAGRYTLPTKWGLLPDGVYLVQVEGYRKTGKKQPNRMDPNGPPIDVIEGFIPAAHNTQSTLKVRVADLADKEHVDFKLRHAATSQ
jgi:hypothetical protein